MSLININLTRKKTWQTIKLLLPNQKSDHISAIDKLVVDGVEINDTANFAEHFNTYFVNFFFGTTLIHPYPPCFKGGL